VWRGKGGRRWERWAGEICRKSTKKVNGARRIYRSMTKERKKGTSL
jgi:hypothetical protein